MKPSPFISYKHPNYSKLLELETQSKSLDLNLYYSDNKFDRLIAVHSLDPISVLTELNRVVKNSGTISIGLPCNPGLLWRFGRHFGPRKRGLNNGIEFDYQQEAERVNSIFKLFFIT